MPDEKGAHDPTGDADPKRFTQTPANSISKQKAEVGNGGNANPDETATQTKKLAKELHWLEKANFFGQLILAVVGIIALSIYHSQLSVMQGQLDEMKRSGQTATDQMWAATGNMNWMAKSMDRSATQAAKSVEASSDALRTDQRAWISIVGISGNTELVLGQSMNSGLGIANSGKTPALKLHIRDNVKTLLNGQRPNFLDLKSSTNEATTAPNRVFPLILDTNHAHPVDEHIYTDVVTRRIARIFVYGRIDYDDVFGFHHWTEFCNVYDPDLKVLTYCDIGLGHNGIDRELR